MKNLQIFKLLFCAMFVAFAISCSEGGTTPDGPTTTLSLEVSASEITFTEVGGLKTFNIKTTGKWAISGAEEASWLTISPSTSGEGDRTIKLTAAKGRTDRSVTLTVKLYALDGTDELDSKPVTVKQTLDPVYKDVILYESVGTSDKGTIGVDVLMWNDWIKIGTSGEAATYEGSDVTIVNSGTSNASAYEGASGPNYLMFGTNPSFVIKNITLPAGATLLQLSFGASYSYETIGYPDYSFATDKFLAFYSTDGGTTWLPIAYSKNAGDTEEPYWVYCEGKFSVDASVKTIALKFTATVASAFRLDDIKLTETTKAE